MNAPCEDEVEVEVANKDENVGVSPPNDTTEGQNDRKRKGNVDGPHVECKNGGTLYASHSKRNEMENRKANLENYNDNHCTFCNGEKGANEEDLNLESEEEAGEYSYPSLSTSPPTPSGYLNTNTTKVLIAKMIIMNKLPLNFVNDEGFRMFMEHTVCASVPGFVMPSLATVTRDILKIYESEKSSMSWAIERHNNTVSFIVDTWTSDQDMNYMVLTGHFIDTAYSIQRRILNFRQIENLRGETIGREVEKCLKQWGVKNILTLTVNNASSNDTAIAYLVNRFKNGLVLDGNFVHVRCCAHSLNLIVCDVMEDFHELISKVRNAVRFVRSSPTRYKSFEKCIEEENLSSKSIVCLDVPTRWDITYMMLESAEKFEKAFERLRIHDTTYLNEEIRIPSSRDWEVIRTLVQFLSLFYKATVRLSRSIHVLSNMVFHEMSTIQNYIKKHSSNSDNLVLNDIAMKIQAKYDKYWGNSENENYLLYVAVVLDPRYKMKFLLHCFTELFDANVAKEMCKKVEDILRQLFNEFSLLVNDNHYGLPIPSMDHHPNSRKFTTNDATEDLKDMFEKAKKEEKNPDAATEVDRYLLEPLVGKFEEFDILTYWHYNSCRFRILSEIAREILAIPVSTIASKSVFNTSGTVIDSMSLTLAPNLVEVLTCLQNWLNKDAVSIDLREHIKDTIGMEEDFETSLKEESIMGKRTDNAS